MAWEKLPEVEAGASPMNKLSRMKKGRGYVRGTDAID